MHRILPRSLVSIPLLHHYVCCVHGHGGEVLAVSLGLSSESAEEACFEDSCAVGLIVFGNGRGEETGVEKEEASVAVSRAADPHKSAS